MKPYAPDLLSVWPEDDGLTDLPTGPRVQARFRRLYEAGLTGLEEINAGVRAVQREPTAEAFDNLYRRGHVLYGLAHILNLPKATHLLAVLDFALDYARDVQTVGRNSLAYVLTLLANTTVSVLSDYHTQGRCKQGLSEVVDECRNYLGESLESCVTGVCFIRQVAPTAAATTTANEPDVAAVSPTPAAGANPPPASANSAAVGTPPAPAASADASRAQATSGGEVHDTSRVADGPEELHIPADKVGLTSDFCEECRENLTEIGNRLVELEDSPDRTAVVNTIFRAVHTVKGAARLLKIRKMEGLAHELESLLDEIRGGTRGVDDRLIDVLLAGKACLEAMVDEVALHGPISTRATPVLQAIAALRQSKPTTSPAAGPAFPAPVVGAEPAPATPTSVAATAAGAPAATPAAADSHRPPPPRGSDSIRISTERLDDVLNTASEVFINRLRLQGDVAAMRDAIEQLGQAAARAVRTDPANIARQLADSDRRLLDDLYALVSRRAGHVPPEHLSRVLRRARSELTAEIGSEGVSTPEELSLGILSIEEIRKRLQKGVEHLEQLSSRLQHGAMSFRMVPISHLFNRYPTQLRDIARQVGKKVRLDIAGADTELDKVLIEQLTDPLLHILRNSIDHGIETPADRVRQGKPEAGQITLRASYQGSDAVIEVADDGRGIDLQAVVDKAVARGMLDPNKAPLLTRQDMLALIYEPGVSTADQVSELSGRGVGLDVVRTALDRLQGTVTVDTVLGRGTTLRLRVPLTLAIVRILLVEESSYRMALPILQVEEILTVKREDVRQLSEGLTFNHRGRTLPVTTLSGVFDFTPSYFSGDRVALVILSDGEKKRGVLVDAVLGRQEVLIKSLGTFIRAAPFVMGCTILSDSRIVLILNPREIINSAVVRSAPARVEAEARRHDARLTKCVLVVDDSAIQRKNLSSILSRAGYAVETANNGFDAIKRVRHARYAALCVDIVMPLMDGFEFLERLRTLPDHQSTPVFLVTGRSSPRERDRAAHLGVQEYFEKPVRPEALVEALDRYCLRDTDLATTDDGAPGNNDNDGDEPRKSEAHPAAVPVA